eukprot:gnl/Trimastix_PCT/769.p1 GENE.gnl/Trimastix_PCT/769~~gnl/Trimastix_PCT/769.p1  ORF type:complete len:301 (-),score=63.46 gnl/Trimastix_PCT/769:174-977(-)
MCDEAPLMIAVAGGTASGKTTGCQSIINQLHEQDIINPDQNVVVVCLDSFYRVLSQEEKERAFNSLYNFDVPDAFDFPLFIDALRKLQKRQPVDIPLYDFKTHSRSPDLTIHIDKADVVIVEGILVLHHPEVVDMMSMKLFVDADGDVRLARRIHRDTVERGREVLGILHQYLTFVKPAFDDYIYPSKQHADIVIQKGGENNVAVNLICAHIRNILEQRRRSNDRQRNSSGIPVPNSSLRGRSGSISLGDNEVRLSRSFGTSPVHLT